METLARTLLVASLIAGGAAAPPAGDAATLEKLAREFARAKGLAAALGAGDDVASQIQGESRRLLDLADAALKAGHPWLALQRAAPALVSLAGADYVRKLAPAQRGDLAAFEAERTRMGGVLADCRGAAPPDGVAALRPAALRAQAEVAWLQVRELYDASLEYARNTEPRYGFFYVGQASGARDLLALCRTLAAAATAPGSGIDAEPPSRALAPEIDRLEDELLAAYAPPRSLLMHGEFIAASALLKEARELDAAGLRAGALLRLLQAAQQSARLRPAPAALGADALANALRGFDERMARAGRDATIARIFLDAAEAARAGPDANPAVASAIAADVLPRWFAAVEPAPEAPAAAPARATVTVVRWPFT